MVCEICSTSSPSLWKGIREYIMQRTSRHTIVRVPKNPDPDIYTGFQGHGSALVLWRDKED